MRILIVEGNLELQAIFEVALTIELGAQVVTCSSSFEVNELLLVDSSFHLIIARNTVGSEMTAKEICDFCTSKQLEIPIMVIGPFAYDGVKFMSIPEDIKSKAFVTLVAKILSLTPEQITAQNVPEYVPFPLDCFYALPSAVCDIFIRIKRKVGDQYVKRFKQGDEIEEGQVAKYKNLDVHYFYVEKSSRFAFMDSLMATTEVDMSSVADEVIENKPAGTDYNVVHKLIQEASITKEAVEAVNKSIATISRSVEKSQTLKIFLSKMLTNKNSLYFRHSYMIPLIASRLIEKLEPSIGERLKTQFDTIVFVSFFHDITLSKESFILIHSQEELEAAKVTDAEKENVQMHANNAANLIQKFAAAPTGADVIIRQHHGDPNGAGFPKGFSSNLSSMAILFVVVEDFIHQIMHTAEADFSVEVMIENLEKKFTLRPYRNIINGLRSIFEL